MTGFVAIVKSKSGVGWIVEPQIRENDGTVHKQIFVKSIFGITPAINDKVLVLTMKNNLDFSIIPRVFPPTEANGMIHAILQGDFVFTGDFKFIGDLIIDGNLEVTGNIEAGGDISTVTGDITAGTVSLKLHIHNVPQGAPSNPTPTSPPL